MILVLHWWVMGELIYTYEGILALKKRNMYLK